MAHKMLLSTKLKYFKLISKNDTMDSGMLDSLIKAIIAAIIIYKLIEWVMESPKKS